MRRLEVWFHEWLRDLSIQVVWVRRMTQQESVFRVRRDSVPLFTVFMRSKGRSKGEEISKLLERLADYSLPYLKFEAVGRTF
jgi:hypothetical protein